MTHMHYIFGWEIVCFISYVLPEFREFFTGVRDGSKSVLGCGPKFFICIISTSEGFITLMLSGLCLCNFLSLLIEWFPPILFSLLVHKHKTFNKSVLFDSRVVFVFVLFWVGSYFSVLYLLLAFLPPPFFFNISGGTS